MSNAELKEVRICLTEYGKFTSPSAHQYVYCNRYRPDQEFKISSVHKHTGTELIYDNECWGKKKRWIHILNTEAH